MSQIKIDLSQAIIEFITSGDIPAPLVYDLTIVLIAVAWGIATWSSE